MDIKCPDCKSSWADDTGVGRITYYQCPNCNAVFSVAPTIQMKLAVYGQKMTPL